MKKGLIFDLDGTLWDSTEQITAAWQEVAARHSDIENKVTLDNVKSCMGLPMDEIFRRLFPTAPTDRLKQLQEECEQHENEYLSVHSGRLFPMLEQTLRKLKQSGFHLYIVSNSQNGYVQAFLKSTGLGCLFDDYEMFGRTNLQKAENIKLIIQRNHLDAAAYVGDIQGDCDSSKNAGVPFIFAEYGFGDAVGYDEKIAEFSDLEFIAETAVNPKQ